MLNHKRNNKDSILFYNSTVIKNFKMKIDIWDESREKQRSPAKIISIAFELIQKKNISESDFKRD